MFLNLKYEESFQITPCSAEARKVENISVLQNAETSKRSLISFRLLYAKILKRNIVPRHQFLRHQYVHHLRSSSRDKIIQYTLPLLLFFLIFLVFPDDESVLDSHAEPVNKFNTTCITCPYEVSINISICVQYNVACRASCDYTYCKLLSCTTVLNGEHTCTYTRAHSVQLVD